MPLKKAEYGDIIYIAYTAEKNPDYVELEKELEKYSSILNSGSSKDIVVDFSDCPAIGSQEIAALIKLVLSLQQLQRCVRIVAPDFMQNELRTAKIHKLPDVVIHDTLDSAMQAVKSNGK
jgi:hypothetical protein